MSKHQNIVSDLDNTIDEMENTSIENVVNRSVRRTKFTKVVAWSVLVIIALTIVSALSSCSAQQHYTRPACGNSNFEAKSYCNV